MCLAPAGMEAYQGRQGDAGGCADQLDHGAVADIPFPQGELAPCAALIGLQGRRKAESPPQASQELVNLGPLVMHRSGHAPGAFLLLFLLCRCSLLGETTAPWEPSMGEQDWDVVPHRDTAGQGFSGLWPLPGKLLAWIHEPPDWYGSCCPGHSLCAFRA